MPLSTDTDEKLEHRRRELRDKIRNASLPFAKRAMALELEAITQELSRRHRRKI